MLYVVWQNIAILNSGMHFNWIHRETEQNYLNTKKSLESLSLLEVCYFRFAASGKHSLNLGLEYILIKTFRFQWAFSMKKINVVAFIHSQIFVALSKLKF